MNIPALRKMLEESTPGKWTTKHVDPESFAPQAVVWAGGVGVCQTLHGNDNENAKLICATHNSLSALLDVCEAAHGLMGWQMPDLEEGYKTFDRDWVRLEKALQKLEGN